MEQHPKHPEVASIAVTRDGKLLWIRRRDDGKMTLPGGHLLPGEEPLVAAHRELFEETGLQGNLDFIGDHQVPNHPLHIYAFHAEIPEGEPTPAHDPDNEAAAYEWRDPNDCPADHQMHVPRNRNVTLLCLGLAHHAIEHAHLEKREKKEWRSKDGLRLPHHTDPGRADWDKAYHNKLVEVFAVGNPKRLRPIQVPVTPDMSGHFVQGAVGAGGRDRRPLYQRMLAGGDRLPPIVVRRNGLGWHVIDGNARVDAALKRGVPSLDAYELLDANHPDVMKKTEEPMEKATIAELQQRAAKLKQRIQHIVNTSSASSWAAKDGHTVVVARDPHNRAMWRSTRLMPDGTPMGHEVATDYAEALKNAHYGGADVHAEPLKLLKHEELDVLQDV